MSILRWTFRVFLFFVFFGFALLNTDRITVDLFFVRWHAPLVLVLLAFFVAGALLGVGFALPRIYRARAAAAAAAVLPKPASASSSPSLAGEPPRLS
ncbi:MAG TPA: LapA family protein [Burkholderiaceae bacterium]|nr:LapA family protein [Burkholderiaceae bacterium]